MKIRNGFVSNSSSSSFVLTTSLDNWEKVKKEFHPYEVAVAESIMKGPDNFLGFKVVSFSTWSSQTVTCWGCHDGIDVQDEWKDYLVKEYDDEWGHNEGAWDRVVRRLKKDKDLIHTGGTDH